MLKKLSLAAIIAAGSFSVASATPLTEAIKGVDLSGMLRIRYYNIDDETKGGDSNSRWRTNAIFIFKVPVAENMKIVFRNSTQTDLTNAQSNNGNIDATTVDSNIQNNLLFLNYAQDGLNVIAGKIPVATPITSVDPATPSHGAGAIATYSFGNGFTVAAGWVEALKNASADNYNYTGQAITQDIAVVAGLYNGNGINAQAWYFHVENLVKYDFIASADVDVAKVANLANDYSVILHLDYATSKLDDIILANASSKNFWNVNVKGTFGPAELRVGYADTSDDVGAIDLSTDSPLASNQSAVNSYNDIANMTDTDMWYVDGTYAVTNQIKLRAAYASIDANENYGDSDVDEYTVGASYQYNKKLSFDAQYDYADVDGDNNDYTEIRLQALYKF